MAEYIEKEKLIDCVKDAYGGGNEDNTCIWYRDVIDIISSEPAADVAPVKHGKWMVVEDQGWHGDYYFTTPRVKCSHCNRDALCSSNGAYCDDESVTKVTWIKTDCCPHCGAKMDLEKST